MLSSGLQLSGNTVTGMLDSESTAMESNGDAFLPDLPVPSQAADWSLDQGTGEPLTNIIPGDSDGSRNGTGPQQQPSQEINTTEKAVEQLHLASAQLFQEVQPPQPPENVEQPLEHKIAAEQHGQEMSLDPSTAGQDGTQGSRNALFYMKIVIGQLANHFQTKAVYLFCCGYSTKQQKCPMQPKIKVQLTLCTDCHSN